jgi:hypothetical protein
MACPSSDPVTPHGLSTCQFLAGGLIIAKPIEVPAMKPIQISEDPPALSCHSEVVAKDILPGMSTLIFANDRGVQLRAMAAGSAVFERRPVRMWIITLFDPSEGNQILSVVHAFCDVPRDIELAEMRELARATLLAFRNENFNRESLQ